MSGLDRSLLAELPAAVVDAFEAHFALLVRWNRVHNLTRVTSPTDATVRHYLDCWRGVCALEEALGGAPAAYMDVGAGGGFPGVAASLRWPDASATWVEPAQKRASFLIRVAQELGVDADVRAVRAEDAGVSELVLSRATFPWDHAEAGRGCVARGGWLALFVGHAPSSEALSQAAAAWGFVAARRVDYTVPGLEARGIALAQRPAASG